MQKLKLFVLLLLMVSQTVFAQTKTITGTVKDNQGTPLIGVSVTIVGTTIGTITGIDGDYSLQATPGNVLRVSFIGFTTQEITVGSQTKIDVTLAEDVVTLQEVVVVGYGQQKKETVVGAISSTTSDEIKRAGTVSTLANALQGAMPGVTVLQTTGVPGGTALGQSAYSETSILIRGKSTWNNTSPLILVDGIERNMNDIDINEVQSVSVLKDASATAVFGVKGGNGVILITTKRGAVGKPKLTFEANTTMETASRIPHTLDSYNGFLARNRAIINEAALKPDSWPAYVDDAELEYYRTQELPYAYPNINWQDAMLKDWAWSNRYNMNVSGGTKFVKYFGSLAYNHTGDITSAPDLGLGYIPEFKYDRFNFRSNLDFNLTKTTKFSVDLSGLYGAQQVSAGDYYTYWYGIYGHAPDHPVIQYEDGIFGQSQWYERVGANEYTNMFTHGIDRENRMEATSKFNLEQNLDAITQGLSFSVAGSYDTFFKTLGPNISDDGVMTKWVEPDYWLDLRDDPSSDILDYTTFYFPPDYAALSHGYNFVYIPLGRGTELVNSSMANQTNRQLYYEAKLNYARSFGKHEVTGLALFSRQQREVGSGWPSKREDWVGRVTYGYDRRYMVEFNGAYNGSEKFGPGYKFQFFPSMAVGWTISNEKFFSSNLPFWNLLKLRYSNGYVGNDRVSGVGQWPYSTIWESGSPQSFGYYAANGYTTYSEGSPGNESIRWETAHKQNFGIETGFFKSAFTASAEIWKEHRYDMLIAAGQRSVPEFFGQTPTAANIGEVNSNGVEIEYMFRKSFSRDFSVWAGGTWTVAKNTVIYKEDPELLPNYQKQQGYTIGQNRTQQTQYIINSWDQVYTGVVNLASNVERLPGDVQLIDFNSDGRIDGDDSHPYGFPVYPMNTYGFNLGGNFKGFNLALQFYGYYNVTRDPGDGNFNFDSPVVYQYILDETWSPEYGNTNPTYPALYFKKASSTGNFDSTDGSMFRLKTIELGYELPDRWFTSLGISRLRLYVNGSNLALWSNLNYDQDSNLGNRNYPVKKSITFGANLEF